MKPTRFKFAQLSTAPLALALLLGVLSAFPLATPLAAKDAKEAKEAKASTESSAPQLKEIRTLKNDFVVNRLAWHPDNKTLAVGQNLNRKVVIWNTDTAKVIRVIDKEVGGIGALAYSPDGKYLAVGRNFAQIGKPHVNIYDAKSGEVIRSFVPPQPPKGSGTNEANALAFTPDSRYLAARGYGGGGAGVVYAIATGEVTAKLGEGTGLLYSLAFSPDGRLLAVGRSDRKDSVVDKRGQQKFSHIGRIELWATDSWKVAHSITIASPNVIYFTVPAVTFSPDSKQLAATIAPAFGGARDDRTGAWVIPEPTDRIKLWSVSPPHQVTSFATSHIGSIHAIQFSADGKLLVTGGGDKIIEIWSMHSAKKFRTLSGTQVAYFALNPTGTLLATGSGEEIKVLELAY